MLPQSARLRLEQVYRAAIAAIQPDRAVRDGMDAWCADLSRPLHFIALGKAARTMLTAAQAWCHERTVPVLGGICISHGGEPANVADGVVAACGDHPEPGEASTHAAVALEAYVRAQVRPGHRVLVLLSGGTSALIGAPAGALSADVYRACCRLLLRSGLDIHAHNALRRQLSRWGNGRLGAALQQAGAEVTVLAISDVPGDAPISIGSAPCIHTPATTAANEELLASAILSDDERAVIRGALRSAAMREDDVCGSIPHHIVSSNRMARDAVAVVATASMHAVIMPEPLTGDAVRGGEMIARQLLTRRESAAETTLCCWGGEPVMTLPSSAPPGGRMQALALAAAQVLHEAGPRAEGITILAAGTDGRDGTTDAAGAVVDGGTWRAILASGADPLALLAAHDSHSALQRVDATIAAFASGTNVNDLVLALVEPRHGY